MGTHADEEFRTADTAGEDSDRPDLALPDGQDALGLPSQAEILARYGAITGFDLSAIRWYQAFAAWKTAIVLQQLHDRYLRGETSDDRMASRGDRVAEFAVRARRLLPGSES